MIIQILNNSKENKTIRLHNGTKTSVNAGCAIRVNTLGDMRLPSYYASLINAGYTVTSIEAEGNEYNALMDAIARIEAGKKRVEEEKVLQTQNVYRSPEKPYLETEVQSVNDSPVTVDQIFNNDPININARQNNPNVAPIVQQISKEQLAESSQKPIVVQTPNPVVTQSQRKNIIDTKIGDVIEDLTPILPDDYPDDPTALAEVNRLETESKINTQKIGQKTVFSQALQQCTDSQLKILLKEVFAEETRMRSRDKIISHIIDLCEDNGQNPVFLADQYKTVITD